jgi:putative ABC transport system permease protein
VTEIIPLRERVVGDVQRSLLLFAGAVAFVLLIACANVANLLTMRASTRQHEIGIRAAIGASRPRLIRQLLTESLVLSFVGGVLGIGIALVGVRALLAMAPPDLIPRVAEIHVDGTVLGMTCVLCAIAGIGFGIVPAIHATRGDLRLSLGGRGATGGARRARMRHALVTAECALAIVLLVGAGLLMRSFVRLRSIDLGFHANNVVTFTVDLPDNRYATVESLHEFRERTQRELARLPGVSAVAAVNWRPLSMNTIMGDLAREDGQSLPPQYAVLKPSVTGRLFQDHGNQNPGGPNIPRVGRCSRFGCCGRQPTRC